MRSSGRSWRCVSANGRATTRTTTSADTAPNAATTRDRRLLNLPESTRHDGARMREPSARALQNDHGDLPRGSFLVFLEPRHARRLQVVQTAPLGAFRNARVRLEPLRPHLDGDPGVRAQVPVPVRI